MAQYELVERYDVDDTFFKLSKLLTVSNSNLLGKMNGQLHKKDATKFMLMTNNFLSHIIAQPIMLINVHLETVLLKCFNITTHLIQLRDNGEIFDFAVHRLDEKPDQYYQNVKNLSTGMIQNIHYKPVRQDFKKLRDDQIENIVENYVNGIINQYQNLVVVSIPYYIFGDDNYHESSITIFN